MANVPVYSFRALEIWERVRDGRKDEAQQMVIADLESGCADTDVQGIAAYLLRGEKRSRGRPSHPPTKWLAAGELFESLTGDGMKYEAAILATAEEIGQSPEHAETAVAFYRRNRHPE